MATRRTLPKHDPYLEALEDILEDVYGEAIALGWSDRQLARESGLAQSTVTRIRNRATAMPFLHTIFVLARAVGMELRVVQVKVLQAKQRRVG